VIGKERLEESQVQEEELEVRKGWKGGESTRGKVSIARAPSPGAYT